MSNIKIYVTKYALTQGILFYPDAEKCEESNTNMVAVRDGSPYTQFFHGNDWHLTLESANERALAMVAAKRRSIEKQIRKLDQLESKFR